MNKKGIILSVYVYVLLVFFLLIIGSLLVVLNNTRILSDIIKKNAAEEADNNKYGFSVEIVGAKTMCLNLGQAYIEPGFAAKDKNGNTLNVVVTSDLDIWKAGTYDIKYTARFNNKEKTAIRQVVVFTTDYNYTGLSQTFVTPCDGIYKVELWGASGYNSGGKGSYTKGNVYLKKGTKLHMYVGGTPASPIASGYNGGGAGMFLNGANRGFAGGGATDVRLISGTWNNLSSLKSRIIVAGGGGGSAANGGSGGSLSGLVGTTNGSVDAAGTGGTQISGGISRAGSNGTFGNGADSVPTSNTDLAGAGGGGYYGGGAGYDIELNAGGGGGSSFISGYPGCNAIDINGNPTNQPIHYSEIQFKNMIMINGTQIMPSTSGATETGHSGNGYARITYLGAQESINDNDYVMNKFVAVGNNSGIKLRIQKPTVATTVMVRRKTTPWTSSDTTSTGTLISNNITITDADNAWYTDATATNGTTYYYKAFPLVNGSYRYLPYENEASAIGGGLVTEYLFEGNLNDTSGNAANSNGSAGITYVSGNYGVTASFNGTSSYVYSPTFLDSGTYSISTWAYSNGVPAANAVIIGTAESGGNYLSQSTSQSNYMFASYFGGTYQSYTIPINVTTKWIHIVYVVNTTSKQVKVYYNGSLIVQQIYTGVYGPSTLTGADIGTCIGCNPGNTGSRTEFFNGKIDQVRMYNRELLPDEVLSLYNE